jgi:hypothetical protein
VNKTLLIIICDFLLISILALVEFKPSTDQPLVDDQALREQAAEEMLELLQLSLEHENSQREEIASRLDATQNQLKEKTETLESINADLTLTREEKERLAGSLQQTRSSLELTLEEKVALEQNLRQNQARTQTLQEELRSQQELAAQKAAELDVAQDNLDRLETEQRQMATQLQIRETEKKMLEQNLVTAKAEMERARLDAERARTRSESLAAEVGELAASSSALKEEFRQAQALSLNAIYKRFEDNRVFLHFQWQERSLFSSIRREAALQSLLLDTGKGIFAVFATANTPIDGQKGISPSATLKIGDRSFSVSEVGFLQQEPGIAGVQVPRDVAEASGLVVFNVSGDPFRFSEAVLVSDDRELYGEIPVRVPPGESGYLEIQTRLFNRLFGEFSPGPGDYVFSMTGELIGIMVRSDRASLVKNPSFSNFLELAPR